MQKYSMKEGATHEQKAAVVTSALSHYPLPWHATTHKNVSSTTSTNKPRLLAHFFPNSATQPHLHFPLPRLHPTKLAYRTSLGG